MQGHPDSGGVSCEGLPIQACPAFGNPDCPEAPQMQRPATFAAGRNPESGGDYQSSRATMRVSTGSFCAPRRSASRAMVSFTPSISNMIRPGWTRAAQ